MCLTSMFVMILLLSTCLCLGRLEIGTNNLSGICENVK